MTISYTAEIDGIEKSGNRISYKVEFLNTEGKPDAWLGYATFKFEKEVNPNWQIGERLSVTVCKK